MTEHISQKEYHALLRGQAPHRGQRARGRTTSRDVERMNKWERDYAEQVLDRRKLAREIAAYHFEAFGLRLGRKCFFYPDFLVILSDGLVEIHEVKGHWEEDALVKIATAAEMYPLFTFRAFMKEGLEWVERAF